MIDFIISEHKKELVRLTVITVIWTTMGLIGVNSISGNRILRCNQESDRSECQIISKQLIGEEKIISDQGEKLQKAESEVSKSSIARSPYVCEIYLITSKSRYRFTSCDSQQYYHNNSTKKEINDFLVGNQRKTLEIAGDRSTLFWILGGIFSLSLLFLAWAIKFQYQIMLDSINEKSSQQ